MRYWTWQIPQFYRETIIELGREGHPLYDEFRKLQDTESGTLPQAFEIYPGVFLWRNYGHHMIYERMPEARILILTSIERV